MSSLALDILSARPQYQAVLKQADAGNGEKSNNGIIDTEEEFLAAAKNVSEITETKFSGSSAEEADAYLRSVVKIVEQRRPAMAQTPITAGNKNVSQIKDIGSVSAPNFSILSPSPSVQSTSSVPPPVSSVRVGNVPLCTATMFKNYFRAERAEIDPSTFAAARAVAAGISDEEFAGLYDEVYRDVRLISSLGVFWEYANDSAVNLNELSKMLDAFAEEGFKYFQANKPQVVEAFVANTEDGAGVLDYLEQKLGQTDARSVTLRQIFVAGYKDSVIVPRGERAILKKQIAPAPGAEQSKAAGSEFTSKSVLDKGLNFGSLSNNILSNNHPPAASCPICPGEREFALAYQKGLAPLATAKKVILGEKVTEE